MVAHVVQQDCTSRTNKSSELRLHLYFACTRLALSGAKNMPSCAFGNYSIKADAANLGGSRTT